MGIPDDSLKQRSTQRYPRKRVALDGQPKSNSFARLNTWFFLSPNSRPGVARRNYHVHPGNNVFMAGGRFLSARQRPLNAIVFAILLIEGGLYYGFVAPWLWLHVSPAIPAVFAYVYLLCISSFLFASFSDPGILPRSIHLTDEATPHEYTSEPGVPTLKYNDDETDENLVYMKYCTTCRIWRPPRASHCGDCDNCVDFHDHHCVWLNNCIGRKNYRYFVGFVTSAAFCGLYVMATSIVHVVLHMKKKHMSISDSLNQAPMPLVMVVLGFLGAGYPLALTFFHIFVASRGESTHEFLRNKHVPKEYKSRPFDTGNVFTNLFVQWFQPYVVSNISARKKFLTGDVRYELSELQG